ncbi:unnamed protein product [Adineta steineri]|nr:unnamed protein product [Adineta steineri]CAF0782417.1 unnamed protein product [Adineta steineri]CAF0793754.1 unnamed protein product [Adineta steineri]CAF0797978.1 unnamed protein product [Adineta steineri]CAF0881680.1 unnamed protein product [Adineta steineri]
MSDEEEENGSIATSNDDINDENDDESQVQKSRKSLRISKLLVESLVDSKVRHNEYLKHIVQYPKIMKYLMNDSSTCENIPRRHLEPFIKEYIEKHPNTKIYDKINDELQIIRRKYIKTCQ